MIANPDNRILVAVDVDGTLLDSEFTDALRPREIAAMDAVRDAGHVLALCTGRNLRSLEAVFAKSGWGPRDLPLVLLNGAVVWGGSPRRRLVCNVLEAVQIRRLVEIFRDHDAVPMVYGTDDDGGVLHHEAAPVNHVLARYLAARREHVGAIETVDDLLAVDWNTALEVGTIDVRERIVPLSEAVGRELGDGIKVINTRSLLGAGLYYWAEVFHAASDKGAGLRMLAGESGIPLAHTVAIGDNYNDLDMFDAAGVSVAMAGSPEEVAARADLLTGPVADGGAADVLERIAAGAFPEVAEAPRAAGKGPG